MKKTYIKPEISDVTVEPLMQQMNQASYGAEGSLAGQDKWDFGGDGDPNDDPDAKWDDSWELWK
ncbi:MAG: hypothetical protein IJ196_06200 [Prevotella sp.]|nr:hypothetical protein [Prevotella sp.]